MQVIFALHGGEELRGLKRQQLSLQQLSTGERYILFHENGSKNNLGGIGCRRVINKEVPHFENKENHLGILYSFTVSMSQSAHRSLLLISFFAKHEELYR